MKLIANFSLTLLFCFISLSSYSSNETKTNAFEYRTMQRVRIDFESPNGYVRPLLLGFTTDNAATDGVDYGYDGANFDQFPDDLFWIIENDSYVIQGVGEFDQTKQYPLGLFLENSGNISISLNSLENFDTTINVFVYDSHLDTYTAINDTGFSIDITSGEYLNRFYIAFISLSNSEDEENSILSTNEIDNENLIIQYYGKTKTIHIELSSKLLTSSKMVKILNINGQKIHEYKMKPNSNQLNISLNKSSNKHIIVEVSSDKNYQRKLLAIY